MKLTTTTIFQRLLDGTVIGLLCLVPLYAFISVAVGSALHIYDIWRLWPEALLAVIAAGAAYRLYKDKTYNQKLWGSWLTRIAAAYAVLLVVAALITLFTTEVGLEAVVQGLVIDMRLPVALLAGLVVAPAVPRLRLRWLIIPASFVIGFGLLQAFVLPFDSLRHVGYGATTIPAVTLVDQKADYARLQSTLRGPNPLGAYLVIAVAAGLVWLSRAQDKRRLWAASFVVAGLIVLFYSYSRSAYLGVVITAAVIIWMILARYRSWLVVGGVTAALIFGSGLIALRQNDQVQNILFHTDETSQSSRSSNEDRASALQSGSRDVLQHPFGSGIGSAGPASVHSGSGGKIAENYYLQVGQEVGWLGLGLFIALNVLVLRTLHRLRRGPLAIVFIASGAGLIVVNMLSHAWSDPTLAYVWWLGAGLTIGSVILPPETDKKHETKLKTDHRTKAAA